MIGVSRVAQFRGGRRGLLADVLLGVTAGAQSYTLPSGSQYIDIELYGGGGGGGAGVVISAGRSVFRIGGGGAGGGGYVRHGFTGAFGGDVLNFTIGSGGTGVNVARGISGGNTSLTDITRSGNTVTTFSDIVAYGGFGGNIGAAGPSFPIGATGGQALNGNITNRPGLSGFSHIQSGVSAVENNGATGGAGGNNDANVENSIGLFNGGAGGLHATNTRAGVGGNAGTLSVLAGAGGGGGGFNKAFATTAETIGATGGMGGIRIKVYG
jgi:hypothetical protein